MNKRVLTSIVILLLVMTLALITYNVLQKRLTALGEAVRGAVYADTLHAETIRDIQVQADKAEPLLMLLIDRRDASQLLTQVRQLEELQDDPDALHEESARALALIRETARRQKFSISNVF